MCAGTHTNTGTPLIHHGHPLSRLVHNGTPPGFIKQPELAIRDEAVYLNDSLAVGVKAGHLGEQVSSKSVRSSGGE